MDEARGELTEDYMSFSFTSHHITSYLNLILSCPCLFYCIIRPVCHDLSRLARTGSLAGEICHGGWLLEVCCR